LDEKEPAKASERLKQSIEQRFGRASSGSRDPFTSVDHTKTRLTVGVFGAGGRHSGVLTAGLMTSTNSLARNDVATKRREWFLATWTVRRMRNALCTAELGVNSS